ncbi:MAG: TonB-dependent receptor, partial [Bacteroidales bacterium]|nr:TonB-dependent receptor [Bacteroidales bacterium]
IASGLNYWKQPGDSGKNLSPKPVWGNTSNAWTFNNTRWMQRGDFLRIKDITLSYRVPKKLLDKANISNLKIYASALNLYTFHNVDWWDPERGVTGMGSGLHPMAKSFVGGIEISF